MLNFEDMDYFSLKELISVLYNNNEHFLTRWDQLLGSNDTTAFCPKTIILERSFRTK